MMLIIVAALADRLQVIWIKGQLRMKPQVFLMMNRRSLHYKPLPFAPFAFIVILFQDLRLQSPPGWRGVELVHLIVTDETSYPIKHLFCHNFLHEKDESERLSSLGYDMGLLF